MKKIPFTALIFITLIMFIGCKKSCDAEIIGRYQNNYDKEIIHYVEIKEDSTYLHYFSDNKENELSHEGNWKLNRDNCEIAFTNWYNYGEYLIPCSPCISFVQLNGNELVFSYDLQEESNFYKE